MRRRARDAPAAKIVENIEQSFQSEALIPTPRRRVRDSSVREVLFMCDFRNRFVELILCYFDF